jgi:4-amino-4-deoxy-L-arabinose transferase-like glycosyltransferase
MTFGLPYLYHVDEPLGVDVGINMVRTGDLNPHSFGYGSLFFYLNALGYAIYYVLGFLQGAFQAPTDLPYLERPDFITGRAVLPAEMLVGRGVSVLAGTLCIPLAYWLGKRLSGRGVGLLAATLVALSPTLIMHSQFVTPNILVTLMSLAAIVTVVRLTAQSRRRDFVLAGIALGAAVASKYNAVFLVPAYLVAYLMLFGRSILRRREIYLSLLAAIVTFFIITPFALFDSVKFMDDTLLYVASYGAQRHAGLEGNTLQFYLSMLLSQEGLLIFSALGATVVYVVKRNKAGLILIAFVVPYFIYITRLWLRTDYTLMLIMPVLMVMAADAVMMLWRYLRRVHPSPLVRAVRAGLVVCVVISIGYLAFQAISFNIRQTTPDGREYARQWITANVAPGTRIAAEAYAPYMDLQRYQVNAIISLRLNSPEWYVEQGYDLLIFSSIAYGRFYRNPELYPEEIARYDALFSRFPLVAEFDQNGTTIRILKAKS